MSKIRNFTLDGEAMLLTSYVASDGKPRYIVEFLPPFDNDKEGMTQQEFNRFKDALYNDIVPWYGLMRNDFLEEFESTWGGDEDDQQESGAERGQEA